MSLGRLQFVAVRTLDDLTIGIHRIADRAKTISKYNGIVCLTSSWLIWYQVPYGPRAVGRKQRPPPYAPPGVFMRMQFLLRQPHVRADHREVLSETQSPQRSSLTRMNLTTSALELVYDANICGNCNVASVRSSFAVIHTTLLQLIVAVCTHNSRNGCRTLHVVLRE
jgi:hypothetical protein